MFKLFKKKIELLSVGTGEIIKLENVSDQVFSSKMMGDGFAIEPTSGEFYSPLDAEVVTVFKTLHAYGLRTSDNVEVLIHIGIDTVELGGEGFEAHVQVGDQVKAGDLIATVDLDFIVSKGKQTVTPVILTNGDSYNTLDVAYKTVSAKEKVGTVQL